MTAPEWCLKRHALLIGVLLPIAFLYFLWSTTGQIGFLGGDGPNYLMLAGHFTPFGARDPVYDAVGSASRFPPVYSALLGLFDASMDLPRAHWVTTSCLLLAFVALYGWLLGEGFSRPQAVLQLIVLAVLPGTWHDALAIQSENLYLALSLFALWLLGRHERTKSRALLYLAAAVIAVAILTREVGLSLLAPLALASWRISARVLLASMAVAIIPFVDWHLVHRATVSYGSILGAVYGDGWLAALKQQLADELPALRDGFGSNFSIFEGFESMSLMMGGLCLASTLARAARFRRDALYVIANLAILVIWPYPEEARRFLWVLVPLLLAQPVLLVAEIRRESPAALWPRSLQGLIAAAGMTLSIPALAFVVPARFEAAFERAPGAGGYQIWYVTDRSDAVYGAGFESTIVQTLQDVQGMVPPDDCIMAVRPDIVSYFSRRRSYFLPLETVPDRAFEAELRAHGCHYVFTYGVADARYETSMYPSARIGTISEVVLERRRINAPAHARPVCRLYRLKPAAQPPEAGPKR